jgi:hypothetical protein
MKVLAELGQHICLLGCNSLLYTFYSKLKQ